jgi:site-specific recombinase XerD
MTRERFLSDEELGRLMAVVRGRRHVHQPRDYALFALLANTGIRPSEALALTRGDVFPAARPPWIRVKRLKKRKLVPEIEEIEISDALAGVVAAFVSAVPGRDDERLFRLNRRTLQRLFKVYARHAGLWQGHHLYVLRHTAATRTYIATRRLEVVQAMLGHENRDTSCIYAHVPFQLLVETVQSVPVAL